MGAYYLYSIMFLAALGAFVAATILGWSSPMIERLQELDDNPLGRPITRSENSWLASLSILGTCVGSMIVGKFSSTFGRKTIMVIHGAVVLTFFLVMAWAETVWLLLVSRFMTGFGVGGVFSVLPLYLAEISEPKNRGTISTSMLVFMNGGMIFSISTGPFFSYFHFHITLAAIAASFTLLLWFFAPESPSYTLKTNRSEAERVLKKLRNCENVDFVLDQMEKTIQNNSKVSFMEILKSKASVKTLIIGLGGFTFTQLTGTAVVTAYSQTILKEAGGSIPPEDGPIIINIIQFITSLVVSVFADRFPRKFLLASSHAGIAIAEIPLGIYFNLKSKDYNLDCISLLPLVCMVLISVFFSVGVGPVMIVFMGELFPPKIKGAAVSFFMAYSMAGMFLMTLLYNTLEDAMGIDYLLWISAGFGFAAVVFVQYCMIETRGKTLQEIQDELNC